MYYYQLRAFHAVATYGGFSKAARQLNISQPAISDQVRKLEGWYNIRLFERKRRSVVPTELGFRLFELTKRMFEQEKEAVTLLSESEALRTGSLRIAADTPLHSVNLIGAFREAYPGILGRSAAKNRLFIFRPFYKGNPLYQGAQQAKNQKSRFFFPRSKG